MLSKIQSYSKKFGENKMIRQPIITVLGHVDHGKTSLLDAIRDSGIASKEAGAITQHIGSTEVPVEVIQKISGNLLKKFGFELKIPGLLFIDTPGHEAFTNLRKRGGSIADLAILVVDTMQGLQPQTIEAIEILKVYKVPFIIAMNKIDLVDGYKSINGSFLDNIDKQETRVKNLLDEKLYTIVGRIYEYGFEGERFDRCNFTKQIAIIPCSAKTREGLPEILTLLSGLSQKYLEKKLDIGEDESAAAAVLESKEEKGLGKTIDVILYKGTLRVNDNIAVLGKSGVIKTKIRALLQPKPLQEIRSTNEKFNSVKEAYAATGVKINAPGLEEVLAGSTLVVIKNGNEAEELEKEINEVKIESHGKGIVVKTDAIGSLEALIELLKKSNVPINHADIGNVNRKDVMEATAMLCEETVLGCVLAFNVNVEAEAQEEADNRGVKIFNEKVIYKLIENYDEWAKKTKKEQKEQGMNCLVLPVEIEFMRGYVFRNTKPAIIGVKIVEGKLKEGWKLMNKEGELIGKVGGIQKNNENVKEAKKGEEVAVSIEGATVGRNLFEGDKLYSCIGTKNYCDLQNYLGEFSEEEKKLLENIWSKTKKDEEKEA